MLYIFHVDTGNMMTFDMNLAMEKVSSLQTVIARCDYPVPEDKQVLLISGGESLDPTAIVGKYHAGTDTNPIFLFSKSNIETAVPPSPSVNYGSDIDLEGQVEGSLLMPPAYETVVSRAQLALQFQDVDSEELRACERLIHDQHLQQQGWAAVVANLEDVTTDLSHRAEAFQEAYKVYLEERGKKRELIASVNESLQLLAKIPVLPCLAPSGSPSASHSSVVSDTRVTLFDWINSQDTNHSLQDMVEQCNTATEQLDHQVGEALHGEVDQLLKEVHNDNMKEVKGLEDRLYGLDQIISGARKVVTQQAELAQGFVKNQNRLTNLRDWSVLQDLCTSHRSQLWEMRNNHKRLRDIKKKCRMAKEELSINLHTRLRWVMYVEKKICDVDGKLTIYLGNLKRLRKRLDILQQVHDAPTVYAQLVIEVVRRRNFSSKFLSWASTVAEGCSNLHTEESRRREAFLLEIGHHFLQSLFQGFDGYPPPFATEAPDEFDHQLPDITEDDIHVLKEAVPELSGMLSVPPDEDLLEEIFKMKETSMHWVEHPDKNMLSVPHKSLSGARGETDPSQSDRPYSVEGGSISLGDQFTECEEDIIQKPGFQALSPPDKEFLLPKSLSEELTKEMTDEQKKQRQKSGGDKPGVRRGDTKMTVSEAVRPQPSAVAVKDNLVRTRKSSGPLSPDMEASQEFTTADFYIDESLPSSIESPPKTSTGTSTADTERCQNLEEEVKTLKEKLENTEKLHKEQLDKLLSDKEETGAALANEVKDLTLKHELELEVEVDKVKAELIVQINQLESKLEENVTELDEKKKTIEKLEKDRVTLEESLIEKFQKEKEDVCDILRVQHEEKIELLLKEEKSKMDEMLTKVKEEMQQSHEKELEAQLNDLRQSLQAEKDEAIKLKQSTLSSEHNKICDDLKQILLSEKESELNKLKDELQSDFEENIAKLSSEFTQEKEVLVNQLQQFTGKQFSSGEVQTVMSLFNSIHCDTQTDSSPETVVMETQTEQTDQLSTSMQTLVTEQAPLAIQTDSSFFSTLSVHTETEQTSVVQQIVQTDDTVLCTRGLQTDQELPPSNIEQSHQEMQTDTQSNVMDQSSAQTDSVVKCQLATQTEVKTLDQSCTQTDSVVQNQFSTQTDSKSHDQSSSQTESITQNQFSSQTDSQIKDQSGTQTDSTGQNQISSQTEKHPQDQSATQTDSTGQDQISIQTEKHPQDQSATQTDSTGQDQISSQTEKHPQDQSATQTDSTGQDQISSQTEKNPQDQSGTQTETVVQDQLSTQTDELHVEQSGSQTELSVCDYVEGKGTETIEAETQSEDCSDVASMGQVSGHRLTETKLEEVKKLLKEKYEQRVKELEEQHCEELSRLIGQLEKEKGDALQLKSSLTSLTGDKQGILMTQFNEAVSRVCHGKDKVIEELKATERQLQSQLSQNQETLSLLQTEKSKAEEVKERALNLLKEKEREFSSNQRHLESELGLAQQTLKQFTEMLHNMSSEGREPGAVASASPSVVKISDTEDPDIQQKIKDLEDVIKLKEEELGKMQSKVMELSMSASTRSLVQDKVSITSCHVGDLVLLCLDERLEQYVVFTVGTTLHFLHTDCLQPLGIKANPGETKKQWLIAEVTDKEYCQAKKPNNRFKVPVGTKFYRVKAKKWSRENVQPSPSKKSEASSSDT